MTNSIGINELGGKNEEGRAMYRSGVAARLAGLPVETLRVWERRYALSDTNRSARGQRLYSAEQVRRLGLLKQLVDQGHAIGVLAGLPTLQLLEMTGAGAAAQAPESGVVRVALVGESLIRRLAAGGRDGFALVVRASCARLDQAEGMLKDAHADLLLVEVSELDEAAPPQVAAARRVSHAAAVLVLYRFSSSATIRQLREQGCLVARVPGELAELVLLCQAAMANGRPPAREQRAELPRRRRFSEESLAAVSAAVNNVACECPRHLADILLMLGSFERYSAQCASRSPEDAQLHQALQLAAGQSLAILEEAMERLARAEGLPLPAPMP